MAPGVARCETVSLVVMRTRSDPTLAGGVGERSDGAIETEPGETCCLASSGAESGSPEKSLGLSVTKGTRIDGQRHDTRVGSDGSAMISPERVNLESGCASILEA